jgi:hypothetical protein
MEGSQYDAGILDDDNNIKTKAKQKFIQDVKDELTYGTDNMPVPPLFPCGPSIPPNPFAYLLDLENEEKFPDFHKNIIGSYAKIARALNLKSDFKLLPICDPIALAAKFNVNISVKFPTGFIPYLIPNPPLLALKMKVMPPPKLVAKFPDIPSVPPQLPSFEIPPKIKFPDFSTLFDYSLAFAVGIPKFLINLIAQMPKLVLKLPDIPALLGSICDIAFSSNLFGDIKPDSIVQIAATKVLTTKVVEMVFIAAVGTTVGSAPGGITGGLGRILAYEPPGDETTEEEAISPRDTIVNYANDCIDLAWGKGGDIRDEYAQKLFYVEYGGGKPAENRPQDDQRMLGKEGAITAAEIASSCGLLARACLFAANASYVTKETRVDTTRQDATVELYYDFFKDSYRVGTAISGLIAAATAKGALIPRVQGDLPPMRYGDIIIVERRGDPNSGHAIVLVEDYEPGTFRMKTVEGGKPDPDNPDYGSAIRKVQYVNGAKEKPKQGESRMFVDLNKDLFINGRTVLALIDSEILCTSTVGSDMSNPQPAVVASIRDGLADGYDKEA